MPDSNHMVTNHTLFLSQVKHDWTVIIIRMQLLKNPMAQKYCRTMAVSNLFMTRTKITTWSLGSIRFQLKVWTPCWATNSSTNPSSSIAPNLEETSNLPKPWEVDSTDLIASNQVALSNLCHLQQLVRQFLKTSIQNCTGDLNTRPLSLMWPPVIELCQGDPSGPSIDRPTSPKEDLTQPSSLTPLEIMAIDPEIHSLTMLKSRITEKMSLQWVLLKWLSIFPDTMVSFLKLISTRGPLVRVKDNKNAILLSNRIL